MLIVSEASALNGSSRFHKSINDKFVNKNARQFILVMVLGKRIYNHRRLRHINNYRTKDLSTEQLILQWDDRFFDKIAHLIPDLF